MSKLDKIAQTLKWLNYLLITCFILAGGFLILQPKPETINPPLPNPDTFAPSQTSLFFAGDIMLSRNVGGKIIEANDPILPYRNVLDEIKTADISFANLESPFLDKPPYAQQGIVFKADPQTIEGLKSAGFDILSTANNHSFDQGKKGVEFTLKHLAQNGILSVGSGLDCPEGRIVERNEMKFGFLAYSYAAFNDGGKKTDPLVCRWEEKQIIADISRLRPQVDFIIVSVHTGTEYKREPDTLNVELAHKAIDAGADIIVGHHPHWIQTIEEYRGKWIFYSLGNFVFDQMWSQETKEGLTVKATFENKTLKRVDLMPVIIENFCCPRWAISAEARVILEKINLTTPNLIDNN